MIRASHFRSWKSTVVETICSRKTFVAYFSVPWRQTEIKINTEKKKTIFKNKMQNMNNRKAKNNLKKRQRRKRVTRQWIIVCHADNNILSRSISLCLFHGISLLFSLLLFLLCLLSCNNNICIWLTNLYKSFQNIDSPKRKKNEKKSEK